MRKILALLAMLAIPTTALAETQAVAKQKTMRMLEKYSGIPSAYSPYMWQQLTYALQYATAAELLAATPTEGAVAYAQDTNLFYMRTGATWSAVADTADPDVVATEVALLLLTPDDGSLGYATDTATYWLRAGGAWPLSLSANVLKFGNDGTLSNATNGSLILSDASEDLKIAFTGNLATLSSTTGATFAFTPASAFTGDVTLSGAAGALTFGAASSSIVTTDNSATGLVAGSTGALSVLTLDTRDAAEGLIVTGYATVSGDATLQGGAGALTFSDSASSVVLPDNDTTALLIGSTDQLGLLTIDTGDATETVIVNGTTTVEAFKVAVGTSTFTEDATFAGGAGAVNLTDSASSVVLIDNDTTALDIGSTGLTNALRISTGDGVEAVTFNAGAIHATVAVTDAVTLDASDCGKTMLVTAGIDTKSITLPAVIDGCELTFVYVGADDGALVDISPNAADGIFGTCTLAASVVTFSGTNDADIGLTKTGGNKGDMIKLVGGTDWYAVSCAGIWANN